MGLEADPGAFLEIARDAGGGGGDRDDEDDGTVGLGADFWTVPEIEGFSDCVDDVADDSAAGRRRRGYPVSSLAGRRSKRQQINFRRDETKNRKQNQYKEERKCIL
jgi:hypothetical protein